MELYGSIKLKKQAEDKYDFEEEYDLGELTAEEKDDFEVTFEVDEDATRKLRTL